MKRKYTIYYMVALVLLFSSCQLGKHYVRPELNCRNSLTQRNRTRSLLLTGNGGNSTPILRCKRS